MCTAFCYLQCYELKTNQQELERLKADLSALETKLKWSQNSLKTEIELHKECQVKIETLTGRLQEVTDLIDKTKRDAEESIKSFHRSQENKAFVLGKYFIKKGENFCTLTKFVQ